MPTPADSPPPVNPGRRKLPRYLPKIADVIRSVEVRTKGVRHIDVYHDGWCGVFEGGECTCRPVVKFRSAKKGDR